MSKKIIKNCEFCDVLFESYKKKNRIFCSLSCNAKWHYKEGYNMGYQKGHSFYKGAEKGWFNFDKVGREKNINWKGGKTLNRPKYKNEFRKISKVIRCRDKNTCQICKETITEQNRYKHLIVHHVNECLDDNNYDNLITLCNSCHKKVHHKTARINVVQEVI